MTKIKNTKKGMAKKTLSISLAVAMLATSNVPVWAAEFTDGTDAAFTSEAAVEVEAPAVEEVVEDAPAAQAIDSEYDVTFETSEGKFETNMEWGTNYPVTVKVTEKNGNALDTADLRVRWIDSDGFAVNGWGPYTLTEANGVASVTDTPNFDKKNIGNVYKLQVYEVNPNDEDEIINRIAESAPVTVAKKTISGTVTFGGEQIRYTGKQIGLSREAITKAVSAVTYEDTISGVDIDTVDPDKYIDTTSWVATGKDTVNASYHAHDGLEDYLVDVTATANINHEYYRGVVTGNFYINRAVFDTIDDAVKAELPAYVYEFTGKTITVPGSQITITDKVTGKVVAGAAKDYSFGADGVLIEKSNAKIPVDMTKGSLVNLAQKGNLEDIDFSGANSNATPAQDVKVVARDLTNTTNTKVSITTVTEDQLSVNADGKSYIAPGALKSANLVIKDSNGVNLMKNPNFASKISLEFANGGNLEVSDGNTYEAVIKGDGTYVKGSVTVQFKVVAHNIGEATFANEAEFKKATYNGEQITFGLTAENLQSTDKLGKFTHPKYGDLKYGVDYETTIAFGENTNVDRTTTTEGTITITGKNSYAGSEKVIKFDILPRKVDNEDIVVPEKTLFNSAYHEAAEYDFETAIVSRFEENGKKYELEVPASDYKVEKEYTNKENGNEVGNTIETTVTKTNAGSNFDFVEGTNVVSKLTAKTKTEIVNRAIAEADVILEKTEYTYTGAKIVPEYKVVVAGETLVKGVDYTEQITEGVNVGEATLVITGKGDYDDESVSKKFTIVAADISTLTVEAGSEVEYNGKQWIGTKDTDTKNNTTEKLIFKLGGNEIDDAQFAVNYPTTKGANLNAGDATITLKPAKDNANFVGEKTFTFQIAPAKLTAPAGSLVAADENGTPVEISKTVNYDGTAHTFAKTKYVYTPTSPMKFTADDYDIIYRDNVVGKKESANSTVQKGYILVVAKGNYAGVEAADYTCANGEVVKNVIYKEGFQIQQIDIGKDAHIAAEVENGQYAEGMNVDPIVNLTYKGKKLIKDVDYKLAYVDDYANQNRTEVTNGKTLKVRIQGIGGFYGYIWPDKTWGIDKFDLKNAEVVVAGTDADPVVKVLNNGVVVDAKEYDLTAADGKATVTAKADSKHYTGSKEFEIEKELEKPAAPMIEKVTVKGNKATVILSGESDGATGYDYVISPNRNCIVDKDYTKVNKNILNTATDFTYVEQGQYYAYCHAWKRVNGEKVFSGWSNAYPFSVTAITPSQPVITDVTVSGSTVTVKYTQSANAEGYDVVLGTKMATVAGERRPLEYGTLVKKNISGNTVTATFKNVKKGTYFAGLHAFNRTSEDGKKVFSPWSNAKKIRVR